MQNVEISLVGLAARTSGSHHGCSEGPNFIKQHMNCPGVTLNWKSMISPQKSNADQCELHKQLAQETFALVKEHEFFISIGGDRSSAIGTWSGVAECKRPEGDIGLLWIGASTSTQASQTMPLVMPPVMPLAQLLGAGEKEAILKPHNVAFIGARKSACEESALLRDLGVKVYSMEEIEERKLEVVVQEAIKHVSCHTVGYGVVLDLHGLDPEYIQAVSSPAKEGLDPDEMLSAMELFQQTPPLAFELVEYNPWFDQDKETFYYIRDIFLSLGSLKTAIGQGLEKVLC